MDLSEIKSKYTGGVIKAGIPFGILNLAIVCALYLLWLEFGHISFMSGSIAEMRPGVDTSGLARTNGLLFWVDLLAMAICPILAIIVSTLAGIASAGINAIRDEKEAETNGMIVGGIMWAVVMAAGLIYFSSLNMRIVDIIPQRFDMISFLLAAIVLLPAILILWVFIRFSTIGSNIFARANSSLAFSIRSMWAIAKTGLAKGDGSWVKASINIAVLVWTTLLFYAIAIMVANMH